MEKLASLLVQGCDGFTRDVNRAIELLERAVSEESCKPAMEYLAELLHVNTSGVKAVHKRAVDLRNRARR